MADLDLDGLTLVAGIVLPRALDEGARRHTRGNRRSLRMERAPTAHRLSQSSAGAGPDRVDTQAARSRHPLGAHSECILRTLSALTGYPEKSRGAPRGDLSADQTVTSGHAANLQPRSIGRAKDPEVGKCSSNLRTRRRSAAPCPQPVVTWSR